MVKLDILDQRHSSMLTADSVLRQEVLCERGVIFTELKLVLLSSAVLIVFHWSVGRKTSCEVYEWDVKGRRG